MGFATGAFPLPVEDRFRGGLSQHGMSAFNVDRLDTAIGINERIDFYDPLQREIACQGWVGRGRAIHESAPGPLGLRVHRVEEHHGGQDQHADRALS